MTPNWNGLYPATTTQFTSELSIDYEATQAMQADLVARGVDGLIVLGTVGENNSLSADEKRRLLRASVEAAAGRVPVIAGVSELTTPLAVEFARDAERLGADGLMVLPAMVYVPTEAELVAHFRSVAAGTGLPIMLYNNPPAYRTVVTFEALQGLTAVPNIVALKESAPDTRRFTDLYNAFGDRFRLLAGLDDVALEGLLLGATGWVSGLANAFPDESLALMAAAKRFDVATARRIYRWFMPLLHLDAEHDLVQSIKLAEQLVRRGSERVRPPRHALVADRRAHVERIVERARATRPTLA